MLDMIRSQSLGDAFSRGVAVAPGLGAFWGVAILFVSSDVAGRKMRCWSRLQGSRCCIGGRFLFVHSSGRFCSRPCARMMMVTFGGTYFEP